MLIWVFTTINDDRVPSELLLGVSTKLSSKDR